MLCLHACPADTCYAARCNYAITPVRPTRKQALGSVHCRLRLLCMQGFDDSELENIFHHCRDGNLVLTIRFRRVSRFVRILCRPCSTAVSCNMNPEPAVLSLGHQCRCRRWWQTLVTTLSTVTQLHGLHDRYLLPVFVYTSQMHVLSGCGWVQQPFSVYDDHKALERTCNVLCSLATLFAVYIYR